MNEMPHAVSDRASGTMYLVLPVPFRMLDGELMVEAQAANGLDRWADNFAQVIIAAPLVPESHAAELPGFVWRRISSLENLNRITCQALPWAYGPAAFVKSNADTRKLIATSIQQSHYLQFAIGGLVGDWAALAAVEAIRQKRRYAIHTDRVEHELIRKTASHAGGRRRMRVALEAPLMKRYHQYVIKRCSLGLWHGDDCYRAYSPWCAENHLIHDVHTKAEDCIGSARLEQKLQDVTTAETLRICYAGRLDTMKAPLEWLRSIAAARDAGVRLSAIWYGEGPLLSEAKAEMKRLKLESLVEYFGFVAGREEVLEHLRSAHALVFTHITPESPRVLLEALVSGTPILGYDTPYGRNLLETKGGGALVPMHDSTALGGLIASLAQDRGKLATLVRQAAENGRRFSDAAVFAERSRLIQEYA